jgi:hypothetical protein
MADVAPTPAARTAGQSSESPATQLFHLDALGLTRLSALEAYSAADELLTNNGRAWAAWERLQTELRRESGHLTIGTPVACVS